VRAALEKARAGNVRRPQRVPLPEGSYDPGSVRRHDNGRLAEVVLVRSLAGRVIVARRFHRRAAIALPAGTVLRWNQHTSQSGFADPRRTDRLDSVIAPAPIALPGGLAAPPGACVDLDGTGRVRRAERATRAERPKGWPIDCARPVCWDEHGRLERFTLAEPLVAEGITLRAGREIRIDAFGEVGAEPGEAIAFRGRTAPATASWYFRGRPSRLRVRRVFVPPSTSWLRGWLGWSE
jgi:hypothetical protein